MKHIALIIFVAVVLVACSRGDDDLWLGFLGDEMLHESEQQTYLQCLSAAMQGDTNLSVEDIRELCVEIAGVGNKLYSFDEDSEELVPGNDYTKCIEKEEEELAGLGGPRATRLAKLSCKYPEY